MGDQSGLSHRGVSWSSVCYAGHHVPFLAGAADLSRLSPVRSTAVDAPDDAWDRLGGWRAVAHGLLVPARWNWPGWEEVAHWHDGFWIGIERACPSPAHSGASRRDGLPVLR